ncbi:MAG: ribosome maturation factor RimM [Alphaproteobacteria bacterium]|nr:ribosome maturation factor RimM [Alphaproteobacteria bacterium]
MSKPDLVVIGAVAGAHGVRGDAKLKPFGDPAALCRYGPFLDENGEVVLTPKGSKPGANGFVIAWFEERLTREQVEAMKGTRLCVPRSALPEPEEDEFYHADLLGLAVENLDGEPLGKVKSVQDYGAGDLLEIAGPDGVWFLPFTRAAVPHVDLKAGKLTADPPEAEEGGSQTDEVQGRQE